MAALAALRKAQGDAALWEAGETPDETPAGPRKPRGRATRPPMADAKTTDPDKAPKLKPDVSAGAFAAVEAAVRKSREEFVGRLVEYRKTLDCTALKAFGAEIPDASMDKAQFIAHRIAGVGKTLGFADLGDAARQAEAAIVAYKLERSSDLRNTSVSRICKLAGLIEIICADQDNCPA